MGGKCQVGCQRGHGSQPDVHPPRPHFSSQKGRVLPGVSPCFSIVQAEGRVRRTGGHVSGPSNPQGVPLPRQAGPSHAPGKVCSGRGGASQRLCPSPSNRVPVPVVASVLELRRTPSHARSGAQESVHAQGRGALVRPMVLPLAVGTWGSPAGRGPGSSVQWGGGTGCRPSDKGVAKASRSGKCVLRDTLGWASGPGSKLGQIGTFCGIFPSLFPALLPSFSNTSKGLPTLN